MRKVLLTCLLTATPTFAHAEDLCVSRMSFLETANLLVFQVSRDGVPPMTRAEGIWATMFAQLLGADFPVEVETTLDDGGMWWSVDGMVFQQRPSEQPESLEQALVNALKAEPNGHLRLELDGPGCLQAALVQDALTLTTPSGHQLQVVLSKLKAIRNATKNPNARVYSYEGGAVFSLRQKNAAKGAPADPQAPPPIQIIHN